MLCTKKAAAISATAKNTKRPTKKNLDHLFASDDCCSSFFAFSFSSEVRAESPSDIPLPSPTARVKTNRQKSCKQRTSKKRHAVLTGSGGEEVEHILGCVVRRGEDGQRQKGEAEVVEGGVVV